MPVQRNINHMRVLQSITNFFIAGCRQLKILKKTLDLWSFKLTKNTQYRNRRVLQKFQFDETYFLKRNFSGKVVKSLENTIEGVHFYLIISYRPARTSTRLFPIVAEEIFLEDLSVVDSASAFW